MSDERQTAVLSAAALEPYHAVVFGSSGAVGREVVRELARSERCESVLAVVRRAARPAAWAGEGVDEPTAANVMRKVQVKRVNYDTLEQSLPEVEMRKKQVVFHCLGTTRKDAGSAAAFKKVDLQYLEAVCKLSRVAGVDHFSLVSSQGASTWSPLLYPKTKGLGEKVVLSAGYPHTTIWRPGLLDRGDKTRSVEKIARVIMPSLPACTLATAMVSDAESKLGAEPESDGKIYNNKDIKRLAMKS